MKPGPQPKVNPDEAFVYWYNDGDRRTFIETAARFDLHQDTVRRYADEYDWNGQAARIDEETRKQLAKRIASRTGKMRAAQVEVAGTVLARFVRRLQLPESDPRAIQLTDLGLDDALKAAKLLEMSVGQIAPESDGERVQSLEEIERRIAELDLKELEEGVDDGNDSEQDAD